MLSRQKSYLILVILCSALFAGSVLCCVLAWHEHFQRIAILLFILAILALGGQFASLYLWLRFKASRVSDGAK